MDIGEEEKTYWRVHAALQELLRVTDEDVDKNPHLKQLLHAVANVARMYRTHGAEAILQDNRTKVLADLGVPTLRPRKKRK